MSYALSRRAAVVAPRSGGAVRAIVLAAIALNVIGFAIYKKLMSHPSPAATVVTSSPVEVKVEPTPGKGKAAAKVAPPAKAAREDLTRALRASGLASLESGDYAAAVKSFSQVLKLSGNEGDAAELLRIARELQDRAREAQKRAAPAPAQPEIVAQPEPKRAPEPVRPKPAPRPQPKAQAKRVAAVTRAEPEEEEEPAVGILLVTSSPPGLVVEVDGKSADLSPAKLRLEPGVHTVALLRGNHRLHERRVEVTADGVQTVDVDLSGALRVASAWGREPAPSEERDEPRDPPSSATQPVAAAQTQATAQGVRASATAAPPSSASARGAASAPAPGPSAAGDLHVVSPSIFGDVWINGRAYGPAPVLAKRVAAGEAVVEIRVGGVARRTKKVEVVPNQRTTLRIR